MTIRRWSWLFSAALALPVPVAALEGEREVSVAVVAGPGQFTDPAAGVVGGVDAQVLWHTSDFWAFGVAARSRAWSAPQPVGGALAAEAMARWTLDALQWIPSLGLSFGYQVNAPTGNSGATMRGEASLAWRQQRERAWVFRLQTEVADRSPSQALVVVGVGLVWYSGTGTAFEL